jgi:hypothetical protein
MARLWHGAEDDAGILSRCWVHHDRRVRLVLGDRRLVARARGGSGSRWRLELHFNRLLHLRSDGCWWKTSECELGATSTDGFKVPNLFPVPSWELSHPLT